MADTPNPAAEAAERAYEAWAASYSDAPELRKRARPMTHDGFIAGYVSSQSALAARVVELEAALEGIRQRASHNQHASGAPDAGLWRTTAMECVRALPTPTGAKTDG